MTFPIPTTLIPVLDAVKASGGRPVIVGGSVRDWMLGIEPKDIDVEVFGMTLASLESALSSFKVDAVGRAFGVLKVTHGGETFDFALPRRESKSGTGHKGFIVESDGGMSFAEAAARRDFTINAIGFDVTTHEVLDPHNGRADLHAGVLRHTSEAFAEDPLRVLRGCQFAARFGFRFAPETSALCRGLVSEMKSLPIERFWTEFQKLFLKSPRPSVGLDALVETNAVSLFPEVAALIGVRQEAQHHPEGQDHPLGSLWVHNNMVVDAAVRVLDEDNVTDADERMIIMLAAFCHDFGKPSTTRVIDGRVRALGHEAAGEAPTRSFLASIGCPPAIVESVVPVVVEHLKPFQLAKEGLNQASVRRLSTRVNVTRLCQVARADHWGRTTAEALSMTDSRTLAATAALTSMAKEIGVTSTAPKAILLGRHLIEMGMKPSPNFKKILDKAFEAQIEGTITDIESAKAWAANNI